jgi:adenylate cyclase
MPAVAGVNPALLWFSGRILMLKKLFYGIAVGLGGAVVSLGLWLAGAMDRFEYPTWALRVGFFAPRDTPASQVKVILIDQGSLDWGKNENGWPWPWPREVYGPILDFCRRSGAKAVAFDMLYTEPSVNGAPDDEAFGAAIGRSAPFISTVVLGKEAGLTTNWPAEIPLPTLRVEGFDVWLCDVNRGRLAVPAALYPIPEVATNAAMLANVMDLPDKDGIFRRSTFFRVFDGHPIPSLGFATYLASLGPDLARTGLRIERHWLHVGDRRIPIDDDGRAILRFRGRTGAHDSYSAASVIQSELRIRSGEEPPIKDPNVFKDCYVLLGPSAPALMDLRSTPLSKVAPGVELHATALDNLISDGFLREAPVHGFALGGVLLLSLLSGMAVTLSRKAWQSVAAFAVFLPIPVLIGFVAYGQGFWWPIVAGEIGVAFAMVGGVIVNYATEGRQKAFIKNAFKFYLGPEVIEELLRDPSRLQLGGEKRELTLFFSDIEKFSSFSERLDPPTLTALLNDYLSDMGAIVQEEGGYLDKYIGDAIVAFWNAPVAQPDHAARAVRAALRCQRKLAERREELRRRTGATIKTRIGLNTGEVVVGNMGSRDRFNYTVLGDAANLASRLEGANKAFGTFFMVSEATWSKTNGRFIGRELGQIRVVGRTTPVRIFEPLGFAGEPAPGFLADFERGLKACAASRWAAALEAFESHIDDPASVIYADRCRKQLSDPAQAWDGVWNLTEK